MKDFHFQKFSVAQSTAVFRVGTDAVLLGALSTTENASSILEIGTGCGIIALMLAQRNEEANITAIDINKEAAELANLNFTNSPFHLRLKSLHVDLKQFKSENKFNLIVCNPPYFEETPQSDRDAMARQRIALNFSDLLKDASYHLSQNGLLEVIIPFDMTLEFVSLALRNSLHLSKKIEIFGRKGKEAKRIILQFTKSTNPLSAKSSEFYIEKDVRVFSDDYLALTKDFHIFAEKNNK